MHESSKFPHTSPFTYSNYSPSENFGLRQEGAFNFCGGQNDKIKNFWRHQNEFILSNYNKYCFVYRYIPLPSFSLLHICHYMFCTRHEHYSFSFFLSLSASSVLSSYTFPVSFQAAVHVGSLSTWAYLRSSSRGSCPNVLSPNSL